MTAKPLPLSAQELCQSIRATPRCSTPRAWTACSRWTRRAARSESSPVHRGRSSPSGCVPTIRGRAKVRTTPPPSARALPATRPDPTDVPRSATWPLSPWSRPTASCAASDRIGNPSLFSLVVGGQGLFGALYSVTLKLDSLARALEQAQAPFAAGSARRGAGEQARPARAAGPARGGDRRMPRALRGWRIDLESLSVRRIRPDEETFLRFAGREYAEVSIGLGGAATSAPRCGSPS